MSEIWHGFLTVLGYVLYYTVMTAGVFAVPLGLPGEFIVVAATLVFILVAGSSVLPWWVLFVLLAMGLIAEGLEAVAGYFGARQTKGSVWSALGAIAGGLAGALMGAPFGLLIGSLLGAFVGTFAGAFLVEYAVTRHRQNSTQVATGALVGRLLGTVIKVVIALMMIAIVTAVLLLG